MARRFRTSDGKLAIWNGETDTLPFTNPGAHADRVLFHSQFNYTRIIDKRTVNVTFPTAANGGERLGTIQLFAHGINGYPRVRGNITLGGIQVSLGSHIPVQYRNLTDPKLAYPEKMMRLAIIGATQTHVVISWYANLTFLGSAQPTYFPSFTIPVTVEVTNEINV